MYDIRLSMVCGYFINKFLPLKPQKNLTKHLFRKILLASLVRKAHDNVIADLPKNWKDEQTKKKRRFLSNVVYEEVLTR